MKQKRIWAVSVLVLLMAVCSPAIVSAHELKVDGQISGVLHTEPDDNAVTGSPTSYKLLLADASGRFSVQKCACTVSIVYHGNVITTTRLARPENGVSEGRYTFAKPGDYILQVTGTPVQPGAFQPFVLDYDVPVVTGSKSQPVPPALWLGIGAGIVLIVFASYSTNRHRARLAKG